MVAANIANLDKSDAANIKHGATANLQSPTRAEAAKQLNVSERSVNTEITVIKPEQVKVYRNKHDASYRVKLARIAADIEAGVIDRLTMKIGRERYQMRDTRTRQAQIDLCNAGLLVRHGRRFVVAVAA